MRGQHWITKSGDVLYECSTSSDDRVVVCRRVGSDAFVGARIVAKMRPATLHEVKVALGRAGKLRPR